MAGLSVRVDRFNITAPGADTDILATAITPQYDGYFQVYVVLAVASVFNYTETQGSTTFTVGFDQSTALNAGDAYNFTIMVSTDSSYNFQVETDGVIRILRVWEILTPVGGLNAQGFDL